MITTHTLIYEEHDDELAAMAGLLKLLAEGQHDAAIKYLVKYIDYLQGQCVPKLVPYDPRMEA